MVEERSRAAKPTAKTGRIALAAVGLLYVAFLIGVIAFNPDIYQWDFRIYYYAAQAQSLGLNPYSPDDLHSIAGGNQLLKFVYPPAALTIFSPLASLSYEAAYYGWLALKLLALAVLVLVWRRYLFRSEPPLLFSFFLLLGFGSSIGIDMLAGNVSLIEQVLLWSGIACLIHGRLTWFCALTVAASAFKLTPIAFLFLLPLLAVKNAWRYLGVGLAGFVTMLGIGQVVDPINASRFWKAAFDVSESGMQGNPSLLSFVADVSAKISSLLGADVTKNLVVGTYVLLCALVVVVTYRAWRRSLPQERTLAKDYPELWIYLFTAAYAVTAPRFKSYSFVLLLPAAYYAVRRIGHRPAFPALVALFLLTVHTPLPIRLPTQDIVNTLWLYYPLVLAFLVWGILLTLVNRQSSVPDPHPARDF